MDELPAEVIERIRAHPEYRALARRRGRYAWRLTLASFALFLAFLAGLAWLPDLYARPLAAGGRVTVGMLAALALMTCCIAFTVAYLQRFAADFEPARRRVLEELDP